MSNQTPESHQRLREQVTKYPDSVIAKATQKQVGQNVVYMRIKIPCRVHPPLVKKTETIDESMTTSSG